jgi:hypothetical protein
MALGHWFLYFLTDTSLDVTIGGFKNKKEKLDGSINKYKWFHDFHQQPGSDYNATVSLVIKPIYQNSACKLPINN